MIIIGADYHPGFQQIAFVDTNTGELQERRLEHREEAEEFYRDLGAQGATVRVGMEASGHARWFERLLAELQFELWIGDAAEIRTKRVRKQKTDRQDAELILRLMLEDRFPQVWVPNWENRDLRQLLWHRHRIGTGAHAADESVATLREFVSVISSQCQPIHRRRPKIEALATICSTKTPSSTNGSSAAAICASNLSCLPATASGDVLDLESARPIRSAMVT